MFIHKKDLLHPVNVTEPNPKFGQFLLDQFGGATGELTAALQYFTQAQHTDDPALRDMLMDIATEEFGPSGNGGPPDRGAHQGQPASGGL